MCNKESLKLMVNIYEDMVTKSKEEIEEYQTEIEIVQESLRELNKKLEQYKILLEYIKNN